MNTTALVRNAPVASPRLAALTIAAIVVALALPARAQDTQPAAAVATSNELPAVNHLVYLDKLPTPASLMKDAKASGQVIQRIDRTDDSVIVTYKYADGHTDTTGYTTLTAASTVEEPNVTASVQPAAPAAPATTTVVAAQPTTTVVYAQPAPVYYSSYAYGPGYRYYDPVDSFWGPLVLGVGLGWATGWHGGWHGGYHGGGWHR